VCEYLETKKMLVCQECERPQVSAVPLILFAKRPTMSCDWEPAVRERAVVPRSRASRRHRRE